MLVKGAPEGRLTKIKHYLRRDNKANENRGIDIIAIKVKSGLKHLKQLYHDMLRRLSNLTVKRTLDAEVTWW